VSNPAEDGFHEIQLTGKQLVFLFMATTVVAVVIFLCGVLVGRGVRTETAAPEAAAANADAPVDPGPPPAAAPQSGGPSPAATEDLTYAQRLQGDEPKERLNPGTAQAPAEESTSEPPTPEEAEPESAPTAAQPPEAPAQPPSSAAAGRNAWVVQIAALRDRAAAMAIVRRLHNKGYQAFVVEPQPGAPAPGYRVRVGPFPDRRQAEQASRRLEREEQFKPFITR
jgi:cell division septation protein DedD